MAPFETSRREDRVAAVESGEPIAHDLEPQAARGPQRRLGIEGVLDHDPQAVAGAPRLQAHLSALRERRDPVHDRVLDERLQEERRNEALLARRLDFFFDEEPVSEADALHLEIALREPELLADA